MNGEHKPTAKPQGGRKRGNASVYSAARRGWRYLTPAEVAARYGVSLETPHLWVQQGRLPPWIYLGPTTKRQAEHILDAHDQQHFIEPAMKRRIAPREAS